MANIFISFYNAIIDEQDKYPLLIFYDAIINGLRRNGNNVFVHMSKAWYYDYPVMPEEIKNKIQEFKPDLFILFNNNFYEIPKEFDCPIILWDSDNPSWWCGKNKIKENVGRYKFILTQQPNIDYVMQEWKAELSQLRKIHLFTEIQPQNLPLKNNICFIGTKFIDSSVKTPYCRFIEKNPSEKEKKIFLDLLMDFEQNPAVSEHVFWRKHCENEEAFKQFFATNTVMHYISDFNRITVLSSVSDLGLSIYGTPEWEKDNYNNPGLIFSYINKPVYSLKHNQDIYNSHKIGININHVQAQEGFSWRVLDIMASNACLVSNENKQIKELFKGIIPTYSNPHDARSIVKKLLESEDQRVEIVAKSNEIVKKKYRFNTVLPILEDISGVKLSNSQNADNATVHYYRDFPDLTPAYKKLKIKYRLYYKLFNYLKRKLQSKGVNC